MDNYRINKLLLLIEALKQDLNDTLEYLYDLEKSWIYRNAINSAKHGDIIETLTDDIVLISTTVEIDNLLKEEQVQTERKSELKLNPIHVSHTKRTNNKKRNTGDKGLSTKVDDSPIYE